MGNNNYKQYKIKKETSNNLSGEAYGLTVPYEIFKKFEGVKFTIEVTKDSIIYKSGLDLKHFKEYAHKITFEEIEVSNGKKTENLMAV